MLSYTQELEVAKEAAVKAGQAIAGFYGKSLKVRHKAESQPVTEADLASNRVIKEMISNAFPQDGWLSEEDADNADRFEQKRLWVIDPLDGTKDFINKNPEFAVSIALVEDRKPVVGVVYNPVTKELFWAHKGQGAFCDGKPIKVKEFNEQESFSLIVSMSEYKRGEWKDFETQFKIIPTGGCAYKMGKVARGDADGTFTLSPKSEWDICAGHLLVEEAGGVVSRLSGEDVVYNQANTLLDGLVYDNDPKTHQILLKAIKNYESN
ncbi:MAG: 3'(2'),5'-bisphosphate nucleotidase CysQ [Deltaproteobacteria bacterium]|nr:3'(2'),5'-bisphosphate nucleotidase CysQ [Deltaproteobacteria bacterium]